MPASALLKFTQGATVGGDGRALVGVLTTSVSLSNVNNTGVQSWQIDLAYVDPTSALTITTAYAFNDASSTPAAVFTPDVRRSYRWVLKVWDVPNRVGTPTNVDIRVFTVRELNGVIIPPSQTWPLPLPDTRTGDPTAKPNEMNFDGQIEGWHGTGLDGLLNQILARHIPPVPGNPGDVLTVSGGRWTSTAPVAAGGDVVGPASAVDGNVVLFDGTSGKNLRDAGLALTAFIRHNGTVAFTGTQSMGGFKLTNLSNGTVDTDAINLGQLRAAINGLDPKGNVRAFTTTNIASLTGLGALTGSGVASFTDNQRVGLGGQTTASQNGIWVVHAGAWTRPTDFATGMDVSGAYFFVEEGTFADRGYIIANDLGSAVVDTDSLVLTDFGTSSIAAGDGLQKTGNVLSVLADGATLTVAGTGVRVSTGGITGNELATGSVDLASTKVTGLLPFANIANGAATSVLGRSAGSIGVMASIASSADGQVLRRAAGVLNWGALDLADADGVTGLLPHANIANLTGLSVFGRAANTSGVMAAITGADGQVLRVAGTALGFGTVATAGIGNGQVTLPKLANGTASSVLGRAAATGGAYADIVSSVDGHVLRRAAGLVEWGPLDLADADGVTGLLPFSNITSGSATSVLGRSAGTAGVMASIAAAADGHVLQRISGALVFAVQNVSGLSGGSAVGQVLTNAVGNVPTWGALDLSDADAITGLLPFSNIANASATSVLGRSAGTSGVLASIAASADGQSLRRAGGVLAWGAVNLADNTNAVTGLLPLANVTGGSAVGQVLRNTAGNVPAWGALDLGDVDAVTGQLPYANLVNGSALSVLGRAASTTGVLASIVGAANQVLRVDAGGTALGFGTISTAGVGDGQITLPKLANGTAASVLGRSAATGGVYADIVSAADGQVLRRAAGVVDWGALDLADGDAVTGQLAFSNIANVATSTLLGRFTAGTGSLESLTLNATLSISSGALQRAALTGDVTSSAGSNTTAIAANVIVNADINTNAAIAYSKLATLAGLSVLGHGSNAGGAVAAITGTAGQVLRVSGTTLAFGAIDLANSAAVTGELQYANFPTMLGTSVIGRSLATSGAPSMIAGGASQVLCVTSDGNTLGFGQIATGGYGDNSVTYAKFQQASAASVIGRSGSTTGNIGEIISGADGQVLRRLAGTLTFGALDLADVDAVTGLLPGTNVNPDFGSGNILTTGFLSFGADPADAGRIRFSNGDQINWEASPTGTDNLGIAVDGSNQLILGNSASNCHIISPSSGGVHVFALAGATRMTLSTTVMDLGSGINRLRFAAGAINPVIQIIASAAAGATGTSLEIAGQDMTSVGGVDTVGGIVHIRGGNSLDGVGGDLHLYTGNGTTNHGKFTIKSGASNTLFAIAQFTGAREVLSLLGDATSSEVASGDKVIYIAPRTTVPSTGPATTGLLMYATAAGELVTYDTDPVNNRRAMRLGDGTGPVYLKAGGATDYSIYIVTNVNQQAQFGAGFVDFDQLSSDASGLTYDIRLNGATFLEMRRHAGVSSLSFFGKLPTATQAADPGALTVSVGTSDGVIADVGAAFNQTTLNNNFRDLADKYNTLRTLLRNYGLAA